MRRLVGFDRVILGYAAALSLLVLIFRPPGWGIYLAGHAAVVGAMLLVIHLHQHHGGRVLTFLRYWYVVPVVMASFRELRPLVPGCRPFDDLRYDHQLAALDGRWFGDVDGFFLSLAHPVFIDVLHLCYWSYFGLMLVPGVVLHVQGRMDRLRHYSSVLLSALYVSYLAYFLLPSVGPHHLFASRPAALDGGWVGGPLHSFLMTLEGRMADAFPSGHALATSAVLVMSWRLHRRTFWVLLGPGLGIVWATMALRYHYVVDVVASAGLLPGVVFLGTALYRWGEGPAREGEPPPVSSSSAS